MLITTTLDPVSLNDAPNRDFHLHMHDQQLDIYFESQENLDTFKKIPVEHPGEDFSLNLDNPSEDFGTDWN